MLPGFVDGHMHLRDTGTSLQKLNVRSCRSLGEIQAAVRAWAAEHPDLPRLLCSSWFHPSTDGDERATQLDALEAIGNPAGRHRIEHLETTAPEDVPRLGALGITASVQAVHLDPAGMTAWEQLPGKARWRTCTLRRRAAPRLTGT